MKEKAKGIKTEPLPKSWWVPKENKINEDDSPEEVERKKLYAKLCASKKPYFFGYNYPHYKTEYDKYRRDNEENSVAMYKKTIDELLMQYENGELLDELEIKFAQNYIKYLPLDMSKSTMNRICWAIEDEFDGIDMFKDVYFDYEILKTGVQYDKNIFDIVQLICKSYKPNVSLAKKRVFLSYEDDDDAIISVDMILEKLVEDLYAQCNDAEVLCEILVDLCYGGNINKQILWKACGDTILQRLLKRHDYKMSYPRKDENGDFWCQGVRYSMITITQEEYEDDED